MENSKETALSLIDQLSEIAQVQDKEMIRLKRLEKPFYAVAGESSIVYHLRILKELVQNL